MPRIASTDVVIPKTLSAEERQKLVDDLYAVHCQIFDGVERESFAKYVVESKAEHTWIQLHKGEAGEIVGYCALHIFEKELMGKPAAVIRMEAGMLRAYRGGNSNASFGVKKALRYIVKNPGRRMFYLGSLVHPSSYSLFAKFFADVWPRQGAQPPPELLAFMDELANTFGLTRVHPDNPLVREVGWITRETEMEREYWRNCDRPAARYFIEANPGYGEGHGLVTLVALKPSNILQMVRIILGERVRRRAEAAQVMAWSMPLGSQLLRPAEVERRLRAVPLFSGFDDETLKAIAERAEIVLVPPGKYVFRKGDPSDEMYLVARGAAYVIAEGTGEDGQEEKVVDELFNGAIFGEIAMLAGERRSASIRAATATTLVRIPRDVLMPVVEADAGLRQSVWRTYAARRFDDHVRGLERFEHLGRKARQAWFERGELRELKAGEQVTVETGGALFVVSGAVDLTHAGMRLSTRAPLLVEAQEAAVRLVAREATQLVRLPALEEKALRAAD